MDGLLVATVMAFALLCVLALRRGVRHRHAPSAWLAVAFASVALSGSMVTQLDGATTSTGRLVALVAIAGGLVVHPVALVEFSHALAPVPRRVREWLGVAAVALLAGTVAVGVLDPTAFADDTTPAPVAATMLVGVSVLWLGTSTFVGTRLVRIGFRLTSSVGRRRARVIGWGVLALAPAVALPFLVEPLDEATGTTLALLACVPILVGYAPPRWLRWTWSRRDTERLAAVEARAYEDPRAGLDDWLGAVRDTWGGEAAWLQVQGAVVARVGTPAVEVVDVPAAGTVEVQPTDDARWLVVAGTVDGHLAVVTRTDPVLLGDDTSWLLTATASRMRGAHVRRRLEDRARDAEVARQAAAFDEATTQLRDDVLSTLSHELRTPLVTLRGVPELLLRRLEHFDHDQMRTLLQRVHGNALTLHRLVESTLLLAGLRAGEVDVAPMPAIVGEVVDDALTRLDRTGVGTGRVVVRAGSDLAVRTDVRMAGALLGELVHNGLTYSDAPWPVEVTAWQVADRVLVQVVDHGRGVGSDADRAHVLEAFGRGGDLLTRDRRGLGVGLTLARELAPRLGASVEVATIPAGGTTVTMALPAMPDLAPAPEPAVPSVVLQLSEG